MDYSAIFRRAWELTWRYKILWVLGILATLIGAGDFGVSYRGGGGNGGDNGGNGSSLPGESGNGPSIEIAPEVGQFLQNYGPLIVFGLLALILLLALIFSLLGWWLKGGLIHGIEAADRTGSVALGEALRIGGRRLLPLWLTSLLLNLPTLLIALLALGIALTALFGSGIFDPQTLGRLALHPFRFVAGLGVALICVLPLACIAMLLRFVLSFIETLAVRAVVLEEAGVLSGIRRGWELLKANLAPNFILWLLFLVVGYAFTFLVSLPALALLIPAGVAALAGQFGLAVVLGAFGFLLIYAVISVLGGVGMVYKWSVWNLAYRSFAEQGAPPPAPLPG
ncbi:MAG: hypothetical protein HY784_08955 [Chloroflexi bacterium]|nr:hypothetical protein [Chloroflexota bacterium]